MKNSQISLICEARYVSSKIIFLKNDLFFLQGFFQKENEILDKIAKKSYTDKAVHSWHDSEIRSRAMGTVNRVRLGTKQH